MLWMDAVPPLQKVEEETVFFDSDPTKRIGESRERVVSSPTFPPMFVGHLWWHFHICKHCMSKSACFGLCCGQCRMK